MIEMAVLCVMSLRMSALCELPRPPENEPTAFHYGKATDRSFPSSVRVLRPVWPDALPTPSKRPERPVIAAPIVAAAYVAPQGLGKLVDRSNSKLFVRVHNAVDTSCIQRRSPKLWRIMQKISAHYGKPLLINSAYRSPAYNAALRKRSSRVAKNSLHMRCAAIDFRIAGVSVRALRNYVKSLPEVGGIGTYSSTIHIDIGTRRHW